MADQTQNPFAGAAGAQNSGGASTPPGGGMPPGGTGIPPGSTPFSGTGTPIPPPPPPKEPEDTTPANFQLGSKLPPVLNVPIPFHDLKFDTQNFLRLLAGSISLTKDEKKRIIESIPKLKQAQIDELIKIFEEEKRKFAELSKKYTDQLDKLAQKHYEDWIDLEVSFKQQQNNTQDAEKANEIRKKLGLA